jgi:hypothetical protein
VSAARLALAGGGPPGGPPGGHRLTSILDALGRHESVKLAFLSDRTGQLVAVTGGDVPRIDPFDVSAQSKCTDGDDGIWIENAAHCSRIRICARRASLFVLTEGALTEDSKASIEVLVTRVARELEEILQNDSELAATLGEIEPSDLRAQFGPLGAHLAKCLVAKSS